MNIALILSGGTGTRMGTDIPKQYLEINEKPIISYVLDIFEQHPCIDRIHIVADSAWHAYIEKYCGSKLAGFSTPGENRQLSILNGLQDILAQYGSEEDSVIIHDAVRPLVSAETISAILNALIDHEAVTPVLPMKDTIYVCENGKFLETARRESLVAGQAPEGFALGKYCKATEALLPEQIMHVTGSMQVAIMGGLDAVPIAGDEANFKITTQADLKRFKEILSC